MNLLHRLELPSDVCAALVALGEGEGSTDGVPLEKCSQALGQLADHLRTRIAEFGAGSALSLAPLSIGPLSISPLSIEEARGLVTTLAGVEAAQRIVEQEHAA